MLTLVHGKAEAADSHRTALHNCVYKALDRILKEDVPDVADVVVAISPHTWVQHEACAAELLNLAFKASASQVFIDRRIRSAPGKILCI